MSFGTIVLLLYGLLMLLGGVIGYRAGSKASLIAGTTSGVLLLGAWWWARTQPAAGLWAGAVIALSLCLVFGMRVAKTGKMMPSGGLLAISAICLIIFVYAASRAPRA